MPENIAEQVRRVAAKWDNGEYDDFKNVILDCRHLLTVESVKNDAHLLRVVETTLKSATTDYKEFIDQNPSDRSDKEGLIDERYLF